MELNERDIQFIREDLRAKGIVHESLLDSLVDHICCNLEACPAGMEFNNAYSEILDSFGDNGLVKIQMETQELLTEIKNSRMKKAMFITGFIAVFFISNGILFKILHWKTANMQLLVGFVLLSFCFLPMYFYSQYRKSAAS